MVFFRTLIILTADSRTTESAADLLKLVQGAYFGGKLAF